jgi:hypothetical protein
LPERTLLVVEQFHIQDLLDRARGLGGSVIYQTLYQSSIHEEHAWSRITFVHPNQNHQTFANRGDGLSVHLNTSQYQYDLRSVVLTGDRGVENSLNDGFHAGLSRSVEWN